MYIIILYIYIFPNSSFIALCWRTSAGAKNVLPDLSGSVCTHGPHLLCQSSWAVLEFPSSIALCRLATIL